MPFLAIAGTAEHLPDLLMDAVLAESKPKGGKKEVLQACEQGKDREVRVRNAGPGAGLMLLDVLFFLLLFLYNFAIGIFQGCGAEEEETVAGRAVRTGPWVGTGVIGGFGRWLAAWGRAGGYWGFGETEKEARGSCSLNKTGAQSSGKTLAGIGVAPPEWSDAFSSCRFTISLPSGGGGGGSGGDGDGKERRPLTGLGECSAVPTSPRIGMWFLLV